MNHDATPSSKQTRPTPVDLTPPGQDRRFPPPPPVDVDTDAEAVRRKAYEVLRQAYPPPPPVSPDDGRGVVAPGTGVSQEPTTVPDGISPTVEIITPTAVKPPPETIPARMLNEYVYCPRLFYYEFVEGVFLESADTLRGSAVHQRVDAGKGDLPKAAAKSEEANPKSEKTGPVGAVEIRPDASSKNGEPGTAPKIGSPKSEVENEVIHSRSVTLGSDRLGVTAKMDLVEVRTGAAGESGDLFALEVCPVDYKVGAPRRGEDRNELWDADKMQLGLQALILRDNGYACREGVIYYRATKQRVRLEITPELEAWVVAQIGAARQTARGAIPPPLKDSPKCVRCSLAPVCMPDETRLLAGCPETEEFKGLKKDGSEAPRRLMAARDDRRALYLNTPGLRIGRKDELLQVKEERDLVDEVRINDVTHIALFGNIQISTQAVQALCEAEVPVTYFSMGGWFYGLTRGHELKNVFLRMEQFRLARDPLVCRELARRFVQGKIRNHRTMLMRNHVEPPSPVLARLKQAVQDVESAADLEALLGMEGAAAAVYFEHFGGMLKYEDTVASDAPPAGQLTFNFTHRHRRPPTDPVNALLSLAYSLLAKDCTIAVLSVGFDPYIGFYHQPRFGRPALALDLMEEFRPLIAESVVLHCVNNRIVTESDFVRAGGAVNLSPAGRKRFFQTYEQRMTSLLTHPVFDYKVSYRRALELQARILAKSLTGEIPEYIPLTTR